jgi:hypothetical protein
MASVVFSLENARIIASLLIDNNVFNTTAASLISASSLDGIATVTGNVFNSPRGINILTNNNTITGNTFNTPSGGTNRSIDLYEVTGNTITGNLFSGGALAINVVAGGRNEAVLANTIEGNNFEGTGGIYNPLSKTVIATCNWWGDADYTDIYPMVSGPVVFVPYLLTSDLSGTCGGGPAIPLNLNLTYNQSSENILVAFDVTANEVGTATNSRLSSNGSS